MVYNIGDIVETPLGIGLIEEIEDKGYDVECEVNIKGFTRTFVLYDLKPYESAHDKLLEKGFEYEVFYGYVGELERHKYTLYGTGSINIWWDKTVESTMPLDKELLKILIQKLEEMGNENN